MFIFLSIHTFISLSIYLCFHHITMCSYPFIHLSIYLPFCLFLSTFLNFFFANIHLYLSISLSVCLSSTLFLSFTHTHTHTHTVSQSSLPDSCLKHLTLKAEMVPPLLFSLRVRPDLSSPCLVN